MGMYALQEISRRNYDSAREIFLIARTCPCINKFITRGNRKMNVDQDGDELFSSALPLTRSDSALYRSLSTTYEMGKPWDKHGRTAHLNRLVSNFLQQRPVLVSCSQTLVTEEGSGDSDQDIVAQWNVIIAIPLRVTYMFACDLEAGGREY